MSTVTRVLTTPKYALLSLGIAVGVVVAIIWLPNVSLISSTVTSSSLTLVEKIRLLIALLGAFQTNFTLLSRLFMVTIAALTGVQVALLTFYIRQTAKLQKDIGVSFLGTIASLFGIGCLSCGSVLLTTLVGLSTTYELLRFLPFQGLEFSVIGIGILLFAMKQTIHRINQPGVCDLPKRSDSVRLRTI